MLNSIRKVAFAVTVGTLLAFGMPHGAFGDDTTRPGVAANTPGMRPGPNFVLQRYKRALGSMELTDDERAKVNDVISRATQKGLDLSDTLANAEPQDRYQILSGFSKQIHQDLAGVLTEDQMSVLDQKLGPGLGRRNADQANGGPAGGGQFGARGNFATANGQANGATNGSGPANTAVPQDGAGVNGGGLNGGAPATQPSANRRGGRGGGFPLIEQALAKLDLSDAQKQQVNDLLAASKAKIAAIRSNAAGNADAQQQMQQVRADMRQKLETILTPDQMQQFAQALREAIQQRGGPNSQRINGNGNDNPKESVADNKPEDMQMSGPALGAAVPDVQIVEANGRAFFPSQYKGHVVVLEFGSMSLPVFRSHAADMERLKMAEGSRAFFLVVYTREAFPAGDKNVERNRDEGVNIPQAASLDDRKAQALETQRELRITMPMAVDAMDDSVSNAFGAFPNGAIVIGKDGMIAARQQWANPDTLRLAIDDAVDAPVPVATAH
jgi:Spy/CpxP family protein refolding chaperone